jgi:hypothetical protein
MLASEGTGKTYRDDRWKPAYRAPEAGARRYGPASGGASGSSACLRSNVVQADMPTYSNLVADPGVSGPALLVDGSARSPTTASPLRHSQNIAIDAIGHFSCATTALT